MIEIYCPDHIVLNDYLASVSANAEGSWPREFDEAQTLIAAAGFTPDRKEECWGLSYEETLHKLSGGGWALVVPENGAYRVYHPELSA